MEDTPKGGQSCRASTDQTRHSQRRPPRIASRKTGFHPPGCTHREMRRAEGPVPAAIPHGRQSRDLQLSPEQGVQRTAPPVCLPASLQSILSGLLSCAGGGKVNQSSQSGCLSFHPSTS